MVALSTVSQKWRGNPEDGNGDFNVEDITLQMWPVAARKTSSKQLLNYFKKIIRNSNITYIS